LSRISTGALLLCAIKSRPDRARNASSRPTRINEAQWHQANLHGPWAMMGHGMAWLHYGKSLVQCLAKSAGDPGDSNTLAPQAPQDTGITGGKGHKEP